MNFHFQLSMKQQSSSLICPFKEEEQIVDQYSSMRILTLEEEVEILQIKVNNLAEQQKMEISISQKIDILQASSQQAYETLRKLSHEYNQKYNIYSSKIDNRSEDIYDQRDRLESSVYYIEKQNRQLEEQCKNKFQKRKELQQQIAAYSQKRQKLALLLLQERNESTKVKNYNKTIQESIKTTREEYQLFQQQIFQIDIKGENLKKYGYQVVPQKILSMLEAKEVKLRQLEQLKQQEIEQDQILDQLIQPPIVLEIRQELAKQKERKFQLEKLQEQNKSLKMQNQKLSQLKYLYQWNPNSEIKQLELNLQEQEKKIASIQKQISSIKRKSTETNQKIKEYSHYIDTNKESIEQQPVIATQSTDSPRKGKEKTFKKEKTKKPARYIIYQQLKNDIEKSNSKKTFWKDKFNFFAENQTVQISQFVYQVKKPSQKWAISIISVLLLGAAIVYDWLSKK